MNKTQKLLAAASLSRAIESLGSQAKLGAAVKVQQQTVGKWVKKGYVPNGKGQVVAVSEASGIPREHLRPDLYEVTAVPKRKRAAS